jgi:hypothetical protein
MNKFKPVPFWLTVSLVAYSLALRMLFIFPAGESLWQLRSAGLRTIWIVLVLFIGTATTAISVKPRVTFRYTTIALSVAGFAACWLAFRHLGLEP